MAWRDDVYTCRYSVYIRSKALAKYTLISAHMKQRCWQIRVIDDTLWDDACIIRTSTKPLKSVSAQHQGKNPALFASPYVRTRHIFSLPTHSHPIGRPSLPQINNYKSGNPTTYSYWGRWWKATRSKVQVLLAGIMVGRWRIDLASLRRYHRTLILNLARGTQQEMQ